MPYVSRPIYNHEKNVLRMYFRLKGQKTSCGQIVIFDWQTFLKFEKFKIATRNNLSRRTSSLKVPVRSEVRLELLLGIRGKNVRQSKLIFSSRLG